MAFIRPMLAKPADEGALDERGYIFEPKLDGIRAIMNYTEGKTTFHSRNGKDITGRFSCIRVPKIKAKSCTIDGELVAFNAYGNPDFGILQENQDPAKGAGCGGLDMSYVAFDILEKDGKDLMRLTLLERKKILDDTIRENRSFGKIVFSREGRKLSREMKKRNLEGVVAKKEDSPYEQGERSGLWLKVKMEKTADCVVIGYTSMKRRISSLVLGLYNGKELVPVGRVGTGFDEKFIEGFLVDLQGISTGKIQGEEIGVKPKYVAEVKYMKATKDGKLRIPIFLRLRPDKNPKECTLDQIKILN